MLKWNDVFIKAKHEAIFHVYVGIRFLNAANRFIVQQNDAELRLNDLRADFKAEHLLRGC